MDNLRRIWFFYGLILDILAYVGGVFYIATHLNDFEVVIDTISFLSSISDTIIKFIYFYHQKSELGELVDALKTISYYGEKPTQKGCK